MTRWSTSTSSQRELQVSQTIKSEAQTYAIRFVYSRRREPHLHDKFISIVAQAIWKERFEKGFEISWSKRVSR